MLSNSQFEYISFHNELSACFVSCDLIWTKCNDTVDV